jgi:hypothetical protein
VRSARDFADDLEDILATLPERDPLDEYKCAPQVRQIVRLSRCATNTDDPDWLSGRGVHAGLAATCLRVIRTA